MFVVRDGGTSVYLIRTFLNKGHLNKGQVSIKDSSQRTALNKGQLNKGHLSIKDTFQMSAAPKLFKNSIVSILSPSSLPVCRVSLKLTS